MLEINLEEFSRVWEGRLGCKWTDKHARILAERISENLPLHGVGCEVFELAHDLYHMSELVSGDMVH